MPSLALCFVGTLFAAQAEPETASTPIGLRFEAGLTFSRFEQQVKPEIGGARGERLVEDTAFGLTLFATYDLLEYVSVGLFTQLDAGSRAAGRFAGFDDEGAATIDTETGGSYLEVWAGPLVRGQWRMLFVELGYGLITTRTDNARDDLPNVEGRTDGAFSTTPSVSWLIAGGGRVPIADAWALVLRVEYRIRYYTTRGGGALQNEIAHGTQNFTPFVGVSYAL